MSGDNQVGDADQIEKLDGRVRDVESGLSGLATSVLDFKERIDEHKDNCPAREVRAEVELKIKELRIETDVRFERVSSKWNILVGSLITIGLFILGGIISLGNTKLNISDYEKHIEVNRQEEIRRDERIQIMYENQQKMQTDLIREMAELKLEISKVSQSLERGRR